MSGGCITEGKRCDKVGGGRVQKHRWRHLAFLKRKDDISSTNSGSREVRTAQCKVTKRSDDLKAFHKCPSSVFPCNALHTFVTTLSTLYGNFLIMFLSLSHYAVSYLVSQYKEILEYTNSAVILLTERDRPLPPPTSFNIS